MNICIVDDHSLFAEGLRDIIHENFPDSTVKSFNDSLKAFQYIMDRKIDLVISDINMKPLDGFEMLSMIRKLKQELRVILVSVRQDFYTIEKAKTMGANGYIFKNNSKEFFLKGIHECLNGEHYFPDIESKFDGFRFSDGKLVKLTKRELEFLELLTKELATKEIAHVMKISENTVIGYRKSLFQKFEVKNMIGLVKYAYELGIV